MKFENKGTSGGMSGMFGHQMSKSLSSGLGSSMSNAGGTRGAMSLGPSMSPGFAKPKNLAADGAQMTGTTGQSSDSLKARTASLGVLAPSAPETAKRQKLDDAGPQGMRDPEEISSILITRVFEVNIEKKYIVVGKNKMPMQPLKDKCRIPADESTCQLFLDRLKTGKTEITVTAVGRDAEGKRKFECYARHFNMSAEGSGNSSIRTLVPGAGKA